MAVCFSANIMRKDAQLKLDRSDFGAVSRLNRRILLFSKTSISVGILSMKLSDIKYTSTLCRCRMMVENALSSGDYNNTGPVLKNVPISQGPCVINNL